jgi:hypothetical protein
MSADSEAVAPFRCKYAAVTQMDLLPTAAPSRNFMSERALTERTKNTKVLASFLFPARTVGTFGEVEQGCSR